MFTMKPQLSVVLVVLLLVSGTTIASTVTVENLKYLVDQSRSDHTLAHEILNQFAQFTIKYNKSYVSDQEILKRLNIFQSNVLHASKLNALSQSSGYPDAARYGVNQFSDISSEEFASQYLMPNRPSPPDSVLLSESRNNADRFNSTFKRVGGPPAAFDWRNRPGGVTGVYNQGQCGSCYAFSATENHESRWALQHGTNAPNLSVQQVLDCDDPGQYGCNGGWPYQVWDYIYAQGGQDSLGCYPYDGTVESCRWNAGCNSATLVAWTWIGRGNEPYMLDWLYGNSPISICVDASQWQAYNGGVVLSQYCQRSIDHCVLLTGWNLNTNPPSWNVRNSWGTGWGESGYIQLQYNADTCAMATYPASCHTCNNCP